MDMRSVISKLDEVAKKEERVTLLKKATTNKKWFAAASKKAQSLGAALAPTQPINGPDKFVKRPDPATYKKLAARAKKAFTKLFNKGDKGMNILYGIPGYAMFGELFEHDIALITANMGENALTKFVEELESRTDSFSMM